MQRDEVAHLAANGRHADLEPPLAACRRGADADHDGTARPGDTADAVARAEIVDVEVERPGLHRASVVRAVAVTTIAP